MMDHNAREIIKLLIVIIFILGSYLSILLKSIGWDIFSALVIGFGCAITLMILCMLIFKFIICKMIKE